MLAAATAFLQLGQHLVQREAPGLLPRREVAISLQMLSDDVLRRNKNEGAFDPPLVVFSGFALGSLEGISAEVCQLRQAKRHQRVLPHIETLCALLQEQDFPAVVAQGG